MGGPKTNPEFRDKVRYDHGNSSWRSGSTFCQSCKNVVNTKRNGWCWILPIPLETLVVLVCLFKFWGGGFGATVSHRMVPELEQRSARPVRSAGRFFLTKHAFPDKSDQPGAVPKPGFASIRVKEAANQVPTPNESIFEEHGSRGV